MTTGARAIRLAGDADAEAIAAIYAPYVAATPVSFEMDVPSANDIRRRVAETAITHPWLVYEEDGEVGGYAYASKHRVRAAYQWSVEVSAYVGDRFQRRGVARGLYTSLFQVLVAQGYVNAYAGITLPNPASVGLHEGVGFKPVGVYQQIGFKLGAWHDVGWWQLALQPAPVVATPPRPLAQVVGSPGFEAMLAAGLRLVRSASAQV